MAGFYDDMLSFTEGRYPRPDPGNHLGDRPVVFHQSYVSGGERFRPNSNILNWAHNTSRYASAFSDPNRPDHISRPSMLNMDRGRDLRRARRSQPSEGREEEFKDRYEHLELSYEIAQLNLDKMDLQRDSKPDEWNEDSQIEYNEILGQRDEIKAAMDEVLRCLPSNEPTEGRGRHIRKESETSAVGSGQPGRRYQSSTHSNTPPRSGPPGQRTSGSEPKYPRPSHYPQNHGHPSRRRIPTDPISVLRNHEVPYIHTFQSIDSTTLGSATGHFEHLDSSINTVSAGGYPIPQLPREWYDATSTAAAAQAQASLNDRRHHQPGRMGPIPRIPFVHTSSTPLDCWHSAIGAFRSQNYALSLQFFHSMIFSNSQTIVLTGPRDNDIPRAKIFYNIAICQTHLQNWGPAISAFAQSTYTDQHLIISYYCHGISLYRYHDDNHKPNSINSKGDEECDSPLRKALQSFETAIHHFEAVGRGDFQTVNYEPMGLNLILQKTQVNFARDVCHRALNYEEAVMELPFFRVDVIFEPVMVMHPTEQGPGDEGRNGGGRGRAESAHLSTAQPITETGKRRDSIWKRMKRRLTIGE